MAGDNDVEKELEPSEKKLEDARRKGEIPRAVDLTTAITYGGFLIACIFFGQDTVVEIGSILMHLLENSENLAGDAFSQGGAAFIGTLLMGVGLGMSSWFLLPGLLALGFLLVFRQIIFASEKVKPKISKINPISNAQQKFGISGMFEFIKNTTKLLALSITLFAILWFNIDEIIGLIYANSRVVSLQIGLKPSIMMAK